MFYNFRKVVYLIPESLISSQQSHHHHFDQQSRSPKHKSTKYWIIDRQQKYIVAVPSTLICRRNEI